MQPNPEEATKLNNSTECKNEDSTLNRLSNEPHTNIDISQSKGLLQIAKGDDCEKPTDSIAIELTSSKFDNDDTEIKHDDNETVNDDDNIELSFDEETINGYQSDENSDCCSCCNKSIFRATMAIILYIIFDLTYLSDILTMLFLYYPQTGGGIDGCDCNKITQQNDCSQCWNCAFDQTNNICSNFDNNRKIDLIETLFPIIIGYCVGGWLIIELSIWIRMCIICNVYNKENIKYQEQRDKESDEFILANNVGAYTDDKGRIKKLTTIHFNTEQVEMKQIRNKLTIQKNDTLMHYDKDYDNDIMGLLPCCFEDIDKFHMLTILLMNTEEDQVLYDSSYQIDVDSTKRRAGDIGNDCCQFPCFMFGFSLSMCWLFPFRYFWTIAICDLKSDYWKRVCWFGLFHFILYDVVWILFSYAIFDAMDQAKKSGLNDFIDSLGPYLERKMYASFSMMVIILIIWFTIPIYLCVASKRKNRRTIERNKAPYSAIHT